MGLGYPGGAPLDRAAQGGNDKAFSLPRVHIQDAPLDMSFSGLKTAMLNLIHNAQQKGEELPVADLAASFSAAVSEELVPRTMAAAQAKGYGKVAVVGGVAANSRIRRDLEQACQAAGLKRLCQPRNFPALWDGDSPGFPQPCGKVGGKCA